MSKTVQIEGHQVDVKRSTTVRDLKQAYGAADNDVATYMEDGESVALGDRDNVYRTVPDGANISFQPGDGVIFG